MDIARRHALAVIGDALAVPNSCRGGRAVPTARY
jgi:hypothetical protein